MNRMKGQKITWQYDQIGIQLLFFLVSLRLFWIWWIEFISVGLSVIFGFIFLFLSLINSSLVIASAAVNTEHVVGSVNDDCI